jgi:hypothetical protein
MPNRAYVIPCIEGLSSVRQSKNAPSFMSCAMPARRLEDRIKEMCARLLIEREPDWSITAHELQVALKQHILRMSNLATAVFVAGASTSERRRN